ncbi:MAG: hypothetical protein L0241_02680 [Planctomycetia bacterium]|nr:hypothetical protein [Planctomycetia bacterium]
MEALLDRLSPGQIVAVISILAGAIVGLAMIVAITKYQMQLLADDTSLKREKQQADLTLRGKLIERREASGDKASVEELLALGIGDSEPDNLDAQLAKRFGLLGTAAHEIEQTLARAMATDPPRKKMILEVMDELLAYEAAPEAILAAVRPLCSAKPKEKTPEPCV